MNLFFPTDTALKRPLTLTFCLLSLLAALYLSGCAKKYEAASAPETAMEQSARSSNRPQKTDVSENEAFDEGRGENQNLNLALQGRKLIREGNMKIKVKDVETTRIRLEKMVEAAGGFVGNVNFQRYTSTRQIDLTLRLPAEGFTSFLNKIRALGHVEVETIDVRDVTDRYVDLDRRIQTKEQLAARLEKLIRERSYQFKDLLQVEKELSRLRLEIEQLQGSLRGLDDRISLSTLHVSMYQEVMQQVVPPDSVFAPIANALENAGPTFNSSLRALMGLFGFFVRLVMLLLPWMIFGLLATLVIFAIVKLARRRKKR